MATCACRYRTCKCDDGFKCPNPSVLVMCKTHRNALKMEKALKDLLAWADALGGWKAPCWERARAAVRR